MSTNVNGVKELNDHVDQWWKRTLNGIHVERAAGRMLRQGLGLVVEKVDQPLLPVLRFLRKQGLANAAVISDHADRDRRIVGRSLAKGSQRVAKQAVEILSGQFEAWIAC